MRYKLSAPVKEGFKSYSRGGVFVPRGGHIEVEVLPDLPPGVAEEPLLLKKHADAATPGGKSLVASDGTIQIRQRALDAMMADGRMSVVQVAAPAGALAAQHADLLTKLRETEQALALATARAAQSEAERGKGEAEREGLNLQLAELEKGLHAATAEGLGLIGENKALQARVAEVEALLEQATAPKAKPGKAKPEAPPAG